MQEGKVYKMPMASLRRNYLTRPQDLSWCRDVTGRGYSFDEFKALIKDFHGHAAPGLLIGGRMTGLALEHLPEGGPFDAACETFNCLPDAIQLLTPCTVGNGWLKVLDLGRFALILYDKETGSGIRVFLDAAKLAPWSEIRGWFFKEKPKKLQDSVLLAEQIRLAGEGILSHHPVQIKEALLIKRRLGPTALCPLCKEAYPLRHGDLCRACQGDCPYN